jgi:hypothetical protein
VAKEQLMDARSRYQVQVSRSSGFWRLDVPAVPVRTQCRSFPEVEISARMAIATVLGVDALDFDMELVISASDDIVDSLLHEWLPRVS